MKTYIVHVSNIGMVSGELNNPILAKKEYGEWVELSKSGYGRAAGESVTLFRDGEPWLEYMGENNAEG